MMKRGIIGCIAFLAQINFLIAQCGVPTTVSMSAVDDNAAAFGDDGSLGIDGSVTYYATWDGTYLYVGWDGGSTNYSSDVYYVAIDVVDGSGSNGTIENVSFDAAVHDYYVVYENNANFYGVPATNGNAFEVYQDNGSNGWNFVSRTGGDDGTTSQIIFSSTGEVRLRIPWATLGGVAPSATQGLGLTFWNNNNGGSFVFGSFPTANPTGGTPQTLTHKYLLASTAETTCPSTDGASEPLSTTLPVELISFAAKAKGSQVALNWATASEVSNSHFEVERSNNAKEWQAIGKVIGNGTTFEQHNYEFVDHVPLQRENYYRLKQVDIDGTFEYSEIRMVEWQAERSNTFFNVFPNPTHAEVQFSETIEIRQIDIFSMNGQLVKTVQPTGNTISVEELEDGVYYLIARTSSNVFQQRIIKF